MRSIAFPKMFSKNTTLITEGHDATMQNLTLLLSSEQGSLQDDPGFGIKLRAYMYDPNNYILRDILIDELFTQICIFMPQITLTRKDINVVMKGTSCIATIRCTNRLDFTTNMYNINLFTTQE